MKPVLDSFAWEPHGGRYRHRLVQTFRRAGPPESPFVVFMINPGGNELARIQRSVTCFRVRAWGQAHGFDGACYLNLFSLVTTDEGLLQHHALEDLNDPSSDDAIVAELRSWPGAHIAAGWGNPPPHMTHDLYDARIEAVSLLVDRPFRCLGLTEMGYPKHGRFWRASDELMPLPAR
jgi:hypothetical protein